MRGGRLRRPGRHGRRADGAIGALKGKGRPDGAPPRLIGASTGSVSPGPGGRARAEARIAVACRAAGPAAAFTPEQRIMVRDRLEGVSRACR
ncbi:hypothetical protein GCM10018793_06360 [Streptomyces sulfonofaciens]|uniref:Uncharacterized protein n=1 Tax=Streptomyces sulfonofaciens TaxID=68272 RepID=A0A919FS27_9ACTN|nr:hypothetical protein GCM10018793_06360 [Streptomyces sulfonofaciens]